MVAIDQTLGEMPGGRFIHINASSILQKVLHRLRDHGVCLATEAEVISEQAYMDCVQFVREAASRLLHDCHRSVIQQRHERGSLLTMPPVSSSRSVGSTFFAPPAWDTRNQVDDGAFEVAFRWVAHCAGKDEPLQYSKASEMEKWSFNAGDIQNVLVQMGLEPLWRGKIHSFTPLERLIWTSCQEVLRHKLAKNKGVFGFHECRKIVAEVRRVVRKLSEEMLVQTLGGGRPGAQEFPAGMAIAAMEVFPHTPAERSALCQELEAAVGDRSALPCGELAEVVLRAQERLQRDRRADELRVAQAIERSMELQRLRMVFVEEAFSAASSEPPKKWMRGQAALGDGVTISAQGLRNLLLRIEEPATPKVAALLASLTAGQPPAEKKGDDQAAALLACDAKVDFVGSLLAVRLLRDCSKEIKELVTLVEECNTMDRKPPRLFAPHDLDDLGMRVVLVSLSMPGRLTLALPREQQEALAISALLAETVEEADREDVNAVLVSPHSKARTKEFMLQQPLPVLVRQSRRWALDHCV
jgi:hypothetical protein